MNEGEAPDLSTLTVNKGGVKTALKRGVEEPDVLSAAESFQSLSSDDSDYLGGGSEEHLDGENALEGHTELESESGVAAAAGEGRVSAEGAETGVGTSEEETAIRFLLAQGMRLLDLQRETKEEEERESLMEKAVALFNMAVADARECGFSHLEARSMYSLGVAFSECEERKLAAAPLFQLAADTFILTGDKGDAVTCVVNAAEVLVQAGEIEEAIHIYQRYDKLVDSNGLFADQMVQLILVQDASS